MVNRDVDSIIVRACTEYIYVICCYFGNDLLTRLLSYKRKIGLRVKLDQRNFENLANCFPTFLKDVNVIRSAIFNLMQTKIVSEMIPIFVAIKQPDG